MRDYLAEQIRNTITDMLGYYGFVADVDYKLPVYSDTIDVVGLMEGENYPRLAIFCYPEDDRVRLIARLARHSSIEEVMIVGTPTPAAFRKKLPPEVHVFETPDIDHTAFENHIKSISPKKPTIPYFSTVERKEPPKVEKLPCLIKFEKLIIEQGLDLNRAKYEMYRTAISGLNIRYGRYIQVDDGKPVFERSRELSREAILLKAAGYLKEEKIPDRGLGLDSDGNSFLVLSDDEETGKVAEAIVDEQVLSNRNTIRKIMGDYPKMFNYVAIVGSLGYFAPRNSLSIERHRRTWTGIIRATAQSENSSLVEVIRTMINTVGIPEEQWGRINCLASFPEINGLLGEYFEKFEKARIGVYGYRGLKRIYLPVKRIATHLDLANYGKLMDEESLEEFCIYDAILRSNNTGFDFRSVVKDLGLDQEKLSLRINELAGLGYCSKLLPEGSDLPIAIYNQNKFSNHCLKIMRAKAASILDVEW